jgi:hypothetical protein
MLSSRRGWLALTLLVALPAGAAEWHVAPGGDDTHPGTAGRPFATLPRAAEAARGTPGPDTVRLHGGTFALDRPLVLTAADSGVTWEAAPGETPVLAGGGRLALEWEAGADGVYRAATPPGLEFDGLFVDGRRQPMARYPDHDPAIRPFGGFAADAIAPERAARWTDPAGGFLHALHRALWGGYHYRITGKGADGGVTLEGGWQNNRPMGMHPQFRFVENIREELDAPGEWFHDRQSHTLFVKPPAGLDLAAATVEVARLPRLVELRGTREAPVRDVILRGLTFTRTARTFMATREPLLRSDWTIAREGAVLVSGAEDCAIEDAVIDQAGGNGIFVSGYNRRVAIRRCDLRDLGASGVCLVGEPSSVRDPLFRYEERQGHEDISKEPGPKSVAYPADCLVEDGLIRRIGLVEKQAAGVQIAMASGITVRHCSIYETPRAGINIGDGCFGGHVIEFCDVFDTVLETGDHGSFNAWGRDRFWNLRGAPAAALPALSRLDAVRPTVLRHNRWRCDHGWDVDLDDGASHYEIVGNLFLAGGLKLREGFGRTVRGNVAVNNTLHPHVWYADGGDVVTGNIWMAAYRPAAMDASLSRWGELVDRNFFTTTDADRAKFAAKGCDAHSLVGDPKFRDAARGDFRVADDSPARAIGFENVPMDRFGVRPPALRAQARTPAIPPLRDAATPAAAGPAFAWRGATVRGIGGEEFSAYGTAREQGGIAVLAVADGSPAAREGLRPGDLIVGLGDRPTRTMADLRAACTRSGAGPASLTVVRDQRPRALTLAPPLTTPEPRPSP